MIFKRFSTLLSISPLDGRYSNLLEALPEFLSESGLIKYRIKVEVAWFIHLAQAGILQGKTGLRIQLSDNDVKELDNLWRHFQLKDAE